LVLDVDFSTVDRKGHIHVDRFVFLPSICPLKTIFCDDYLV
jgi:hypothetical protein